MRNASIVFLLAFNIIFTSSFAFAQENNFLPSAQGTSYIGEEENIYLNRGQQQNTQTTVTSAQRVNGSVSGVYEGTRLSCPYVFERDLFVGVTGEDVRLLQVLLNSDRRTVIALDGPGSPGKETTSFGESTKESVKKFQALFIEYIGVANGRFGPRTRTTMNAICNGSNSATGGQAYENVESVQQNATPAGQVTTIPNDKIAPRVSLAANLNSVEPSATFKIITNFSEDVKTISADIFIVDGGSVKEIRKLSKTSYSVTITPNEDTRSVMVQVEADKVSDLAGNLNENASNEITVRLRSANLANAVNPNNNPQPQPNSQPICNYDEQGRIILINPNNGSPVNTQGCAPTKTNTAAFNSTLGCYADTGPLPPGITDVQRCNHPQNPNNPNSPCSKQNQDIYRQQLLQYQEQRSQSRFTFGLGPAPRNPCENAQIANATAATAQQQFNNNRQNAQRQAQQAQQNQQLGQMLGNLLRGGGLGGLGGGGPQGNGPTGPGSNTPWENPDEKKGEDKTSVESNAEEGDNCQVTRPEGGIGGRGKIVSGKCVEDPDKDSSTEKPEGKAEAQKNEKPTSAEKTEDLTKKCYYIYDKQDSLIANVTPSPYNFLKAKDKITKEEYYLFGKIKLKDLTSNRLSNFDGLESTFQLDESSNEIKGAAYCCTNKRSPVGKTKDLDQCKDKMEFKDLKVYKNNGAPIEFVQPNK